MALCYGYDCTLTSYIVQQRMFSAYFEGNT